MLSSNGSALPRRVGGAFEAICGEVVQWIRCLGRVEDRGRHRVLETESDLRVAWWVVVNVLCYAMNAQRRKLYIYETNDRVRELQHVRYKSGEPWRRRGSLGW